MKLFLISVLWRGAISEQPFFEQISLGSFESQLQEKIYVSDPGDEDDFSIVICKFTFDKNEILHEPHKVRFDGVNGYRVYFFNSEIFIKVDQRSIGKYKLLILAPNKPLIVSLKNPPEIIKQIYDEVSKNS